MDLFTYTGGALHAEGVSLDTIASEVGTPTYVYSAGTIREHYRRLADAFAPLDPLICYSIKSCGNLSICRLIGELGGGMDVVSGGELERAVAAGVPAAKCVFAGVGKTDEEIRAAIGCGIGLLNVESEAEFENIAAIAGQMRREARCALRVNPDVDPKTHRYTSTGKKETKFGVDIERAKAFFDRYGRGEFARFAKLVGLHLHIGSPVYTTAPYVDAVTKTIALIDELTRGGHRIEVLDLGGGFGADYESDQSPVAADYAEAIVPLLAERARTGLKFILEPGRTIVANAGILLLRVLYMKTSGEKTFAICDGGMNALLRPSHYNAFHFMWPVNPAAGFVPQRRAKEMSLPGLVPMDVVGPICESGDFLAVDRPLPPLKRGDMLAVFTAGAYGMSMASRYNASPLPAEVLVDGDAFRVVRRRETYADLMAHER